MIFHFFILLGTEEIIFPSCFFPGDLFKSLRVPLRWWWCIYIVGTAGRVDLLTKPFACISMQLCCGKRCKENKQNSFQWKEEKCSDEGQAEDKEADLLSDWVSDACSSPEGTAPLQATSQRGTHLNSS